MNLSDLLEELALRPESLSQGEIITIANHFSDEDITRLAKKFINGHNPSGFDWFITNTLGGIVNHYDRYQELTRKQRVYIVANVYNNWSRLTLEGRYLMGL